MNFIDVEQNLVKENFFLHQMLIRYQVEGPGS